MNDGSTELLQTGNLYPMVIHRDDVMPLLLDAVPSFRGIWEDEVLPENKDGDDRLHYLDASAFSRHLVDRLQNGADDEVRRAFHVIERLHREGDHYVQELATIGYLEDIQNVAERAGIDSDELVAYLGPETLRWWNGLNAFWSGRAPAVLPKDTPVSDS